MMQKSRIIKSVNYEGHLYLEKINTSDLCFISFFFCLKFLIGWNEKCWAKNKIMNFIAENFKILKFPTSFFSFFFFFANFHLNNVSLDLILRRFSSNKLTVTSILLLEFKIICLLIEIIHAFLRYFTFKGYWIYYLSWPFNPGCVSHIETNKSRLFLSCLWQFLNRVTFFEASGPV